MKKRHVVLSAALIAMLALSGCGGQQQPQKDEPKAMTAEEIITASNEAMNDLDSYGFTMNTNMQMDMKEQGSMDMTMVSKAQTIVKPNVLIKMDSDITINIPDQDPQTMSMTQYIEGTETGIAMYQDMAGAWSKVVVDDPSLVESMTQNPQDALESYKETMEKAEILGEEKVGDRDCYKIEMTLSKEALDEVMADFNGAGLDEKTLAASKEIVANMNDLTTVLWIDKENYQMLKQSMDISDIIRQAVIAELKNAGQSEDSIGDVTMSMEILYDNYNGVSEIVIPDDAKNAQEITM